ncbi:MAG: hypothetical protein HHJ14_11250 [Cellulomonas sp.]|uniref:hypothetical protein n=1 Tax=Cellulomonas sp. TaxID=40001 RepID=UPI00183FDD3A|nr:hypothetical protein [Cellulomonas sp.]NMM17670.1 hypothetical protein [Cellulomonas sp.]NMM30408.1 hypothetical protein [Cellulomonas sp.]
MKRLFWIAIGAAVTVVVIRKGAALSERYLPAGARDAAGTLGRVTTAARTVKTEFLAGLAEREAELRHDLIGDVDVEALRSERARDRADALRAGRATRAGRGWADGATEDPEDDGDDGVPYSFF